MKTRPNPRSSAHKTRFEISIKLFRIAKISIKPISTSLVTKKPPVPLVDYDVGDSDSDSDGGSPPPPLPSLKAASPEAPDDPPGARPECLRPSTPPSILEPAGSEAGLKEAEKADNERMETGKEEERETSEWCGLLC